MLRKLLCAKWLCVVLPVLALSLAPAGCSSESGAASGASASTSSKLNGTWQIDPEMAKSQPEFKDAPKDVQDMMMKAMEMMKMEVTFSGSEVRMVSDMMGQKDDESWPYTVVSESGNVIVIEGTDKEGLKQRLELTVDGDKMTVVDGPESFTLVRK